MFSSVLLAIGVLTFCLDVTSSASISTSLSNGVCLCTNEQNVAALRDHLSAGNKTNIILNLISIASDSSSVLQTLANGQCFLSNGGIYHSNGETWYEIKDSSSQTAWVDSYYLSISDMGSCKGRLDDQSANNHVPTGKAADCQVNSQLYSHGQHFLLHGVYCTCDDGVPLCSFQGQNCLDDGIVYAHGSTVDISGRGVCHCSQGTLTCGSGSAVGR